MASFLSAIGQQGLRDLLDYDRSNGVLRWRARPETDQYVKTWNVKNASNPALICHDSSGYLHGTIHGKKAYAHRVIWVMEIGEDAQLVDHINGNRSDNRLANLRSVDRVQNCRNVGLRSTNKTGVPGVFWYERYQMFQVMIGYTHLGRFGTLEEATVVRKRAEEKRNYHENNGNRPAHSLIKELVA